MVREHTVAKKVDHRRKKEVKRSRWLLRLKMAS